MQSTYQADEILKIRKSLIDVGQFNDEAAELLVALIAGRTSPQMEEVVDAIKNEITRTDLATKADLKEALEPYATKADLKEALEPLATVESVDTKIAEVKLWAFKLIAGQTAVILVGMRALEYLWPT